MKKLHIKKASGESSFIVQGNIIEGTRDVLLQSFAKIQGDVELDLSGVTITNSLGIKEWIDALAELSHVKFKLVKCPPAIVQTINMIPAFAGNGHVGSVIGTFYCTGCEVNKDIEVNTNTDIDANLELKLEVTCEACGQPDMQLEMSPEEYFEFLESA